MRIVIFGSGGLAKELIGYVEGTHEVVGIVSTEPLNNPAYKFDVWPSVPEGLGDVGYLMGVSDPAIKRKIVAENKDRWISYVHPTCTVSSYVKMGKGCVLTPQSIVVADAMLGDFVFINTNGTVGHDSIIGSFTTMFPNTEVCGNCVIDEDCIFGIGSYVLPNVKLPRGTKVSAGAVVRKSVESACTLYGDPARPRLQAV